MKCSRRAGFSHFWRYDRNTPEEGTEREISCTPPPPAVVRWYGSDVYKPRIYQGFCESDTTARDHRNLRWYPGSGSFVIRMVYSRDSTGVGSPPPAGEAQTSWGRWSRGQGPVMSQCPCGAPGGCRTVRRLGRSAAKPGWLLVAQRRRLQAHRYPLWAGILQRAGQPEPSESLGTASKTAAPMTGTSFA